MELTIRADVSAHMRELKQWLAQTRDEPAEDMNGFFAARVDTYEAHMSVWDKAYGRVAELTPGDCGPPAGPRLRHRAGAGPHLCPLAGACRHGSGPVRGHAGKAACEACRAAA